MDLQPNQQPTVGYILSVWPRLSETFILNEVIALVRWAAGEQLDKLG